MVLNKRNILKHLASFPTLRIERASKTHSTGRGREADRSGPDMGGAGDEECGDGHR